MSPTSGDRGLERPCSARGLEAKSAHPLSTRSSSTLQPCGKRWDPLRCRGARSSTQTLGFQPRQGVRAQITMSAKPGAGKLMPRFTIRAQLRALRGQSRTRTWSGLISRPSQRRCSSTISGRSWHSKTLNCTLSNTICQSAHEQFPINRCHQRVVTPASSTSSLSSMPCFQSIGVTNGW